MKYRLPGAYLCFENGLEFQSPLDVFEHFTRGVTEINETTYQQKHSIACVRTKAGPQAGWNFCASTPQT